MSNPFFSRSTAFKEGGHAPGTAPAQTPNGYPTMPGYQPASTASRQPATASSTASTATSTVSRWPATAR